jgi:hypothetical protein
MGKHNRLCSLIALVFPIVSVSVHGVVIAEEFRIVLALSNGINDNENVVDNIKFIV